MKKYMYWFAWAFIGSYTFAQSPTSVCNKWTIGVASGSSFFATGSSKVALSPLSHLELNLRRNFNSRIGLKLDVHNSSFTFVDKFPTTSNVHVGFQAHYNLLAPEKFFNISAHGGLGYSALVNRTYYNGPNQLFKPFTGSIDEVVQLVFGFTPSIRLTGGLALVLDASIYGNMLQNNSFDFKQFQLSPGVGLYATAAVGLTYSFACFQTKTTANTAVPDPKLDDLQRELEVQRKLLQDDDADGVINATDLEPNTATGLKVDKNGIGIPPQDPTTIDTDQDGTPDIKDNCPTVKGAVNGCPEPSTEEKDAKALYDYGIYDILFVKGSAYINPAYFPILDKVVSYLNENPTVIIDITGHADIDGGDEINNKLSEARVQEVAKYLTAKGINPKRLQVTAKGKKQIKYAGDTLEADAANRRVSFSIHR